MLLGRGVASLPSGSRSHWQLINAWECRRPPCCPLRRTRHTAVTPTVKPEEDGRRDHAPPAQSSRQTLARPGQKPPTRASISDPEQQDQRSNHPVPCSSSAPANAENALRAATQQFPLSAELLRLCDLSIVLSRDSSDGQSFVKAKRYLRQATGIYLRMVRQSTAQSDVDALAYETYLIRSGYAHVVRTIGALTGSGNVYVCAEMLTDYLRWELDLVQLGFKTGDGSQEWVEAQKEAHALRKDKDTDLEEALLSSGPFLQDMAPILFDVFFDLTIDARRIGQRSTFRSLASDRSAYLARKVWQSVRQFPSHVWDRPLSNDWYRLRNHPQSPFETGADMVNACSVMYANACLSTARLEDAMTLWRDEVVFWQVKSKHLDRLMFLISDSMRRSRRRLLLRLPVYEASVDEESSELKAYVRGLRTFSYLLRHSRLEDAGQVLARALDSSHLNTLLRCIASSEELLEHRLVATDEVKEDLLHANGLFRAWLAATLDQADNRWLLSKLKISTYNLILDRITRTSQTFGGFDFHPALLLLDRMSNNPDIPSPNESTLTIMMYNAARARQRAVTRASLVAAHDLMVKRSDHSGSDNASFPQSPSSMHSSFPVVQMLSLLRDAVFRDDAPRLVSLLKAACLPAGRRRALDHGRARGIRDAKVACLSANQAVFLLYPSLHIRSRRGQGRLAKRVAARGNRVNATAEASARNQSRQLEIGQRESSAQFRLPVLVSVLHLAIQQGKTGLAERVWRLLMRVTVRKKHRMERERERGQVMLPQADLTLSIQAFTAMMRLYAKEARRAWLRLRGRQRSAPHFGRHEVISRSSSAQIVRGWSKVRSGPMANLYPSEALLADRSLAARTMAIQRYAELKSMWNAERPSTTDPLRPDEQFFVTLLSVFRSTGCVRGSLEARDPTVRAFLHCVAADMVAVHVRLPDDLKPFHVQ